MNKKKHVLLSWFFCTLTMMAWMGTANAVPNFASKTDKNCSYCHNAWPQLNKKGREFKELGYRLPAELKGESRAQGFLEQGTFPIGAMLIARPYDKRDSGDYKIRALHEIEVFIAGAFGNDWSGFLEIEAEDETGFEPEFAPAVLAYNHSRPLNLDLAWGPFLWADPYGFLGDNFRLTRSSVSVINQGFGGADANGSLLSNRQSISLTGRLFERLFYIAGTSGEADDAEGVKASNYHARLAFDLTDAFMVGAFGIDGETDARTTTATSTQTVGGIPGVVVQTTSTSPMRNFNRYGADFQADLASLRIQGAYVMAEDDNATATGTVENNAWSVQSYYPFKTKTGKPTVVPLIRYDNYERNNGQDTFEELTLNIGYYFAENVKAYLEYWKQLDVPPGANAGFGEDDRVTVQLYVAF